MSKTDDGSQPIQPEDTLPLAEVFPVEEFLLVLWLVKAANEAYKWNKDEYGDWDEGDKVHSAFLISYAQELL